MLKGNKYIEYRRELRRLIYLSRNSSLSYRKENFTFIQICTIRIWYNGHYLYNVELYYNDDKRISSIFFKKKDGNTMITMYNKKFDIPIYPLPLYLDTVNEHMLISILKHI